MQSVLRKAEFERLIAAYAEGAQERADGLRAVAAIGDLAAMTRAAQDIGSIAANVGARRLKDLAGALETACRERRPEDADRITAEPMAHVVLRRLKPNVAWCYRQICGFGSGHKRFLASELTARRGR